MNLTCYVTSSKVTLCKKLGRKIRNAAPKFFHSASEQEPHGEWVWRPSNHLLDVSMYEKCIITDA